MPFQRTVFTCLVTTLLVLFAPAAHAAVPTAATIDAELSRAFPASAPGAAVLVIKDGKTILSKGYGLANVELHVPMQPDQLFAVASVGKQFTAAAILKLAEAGKLKLDDPVRTYFPGVPPAWDGITITHLLQHTSGIANLFMDAAFRAHAFEPHTPAQLLAQAQATPLLAPPGKAFAYASVNYTLLAMIIEQVSGEKYDAYLAHQFFVPLGMTHTHFIAEGKLVKGVATPYEPGPRLAVRWSSTLGFGAGSFTSNNADLARWTAALQGGRVLQPASLQAMNTAATLSGGQRVPYGYGLRPHTLAGQPYIQSNGDIQGFHSEVVYLPQAKVFVSMLLNGEDTLRYGPGPLVKRIATLTAGMAQHPAVARTLPEAVLESRAGVYTHRAEQYTFQVKDGRLLAQYPDATSRWEPLTAVSPTEFYYAANSDFRIRFLTGASGRPASQWFETDPLDDDADPVFERR